MPGGAGITTFAIDIFTQNANILPELAERAKDMTPAFNVIIDQWVKGNPEKFAAGSGMEASGVDQDAGVFWQPLTPTYMASKRRAGYADQLMVASGALLASMSDPDTIFQAVNPEDALFGTPLDPDDAAKVQYNWNKRQTIFLSLDDQRMIEKTVQDYLSFGPNFEQILFAKGVAATQRRHDIAQMDINFANTVA